MRSKSIASTHRVWSGILGPSAAASWQKKVARRLLASLVVWPGQSRESWLWWTFACLIDLGLPANVPQILLYPIWTWYLILYHLKQWQGPVTLLVERFHRFPLIFHFLRRCRLHNMHSYSRNQYSLAWLQIALNMFITKVTSGFSFRI